MDIYIYIYIYIEREREREIDREGQREKKIYIDGANAPPPFVLYLCFNIGNIIILIIYNYIYNYIYSPLDFNVSNDYLPMTILCRSRMSVEGTWPSPLS
jgi:hypothetical protein